MSILATAIETAVRLIEGEISHTQYRIAICEIDKIETHGIKADVAKWRDQIKALKAVGSSTGAPEVGEPDAKLERAYRTVDLELGPTFFVNAMLSACDPSNWDADKNQGDYFRGLRDAYEAIHETTNEFQRSMYAWDHIGRAAMAQRAAPPVRSAANTVEPVAYRWRHVNDPSCKWHHVKAPFKHGEYIVSEPLYAAPTTSPEPTSLQKTQTSPAPEPDAVREALQALLDHVDNETCAHKETKRGGSIWTICVDCGQKWADDEGGFKPRSDAPAVAAARAALSRPAHGGWSRNQLAETIHNARWPADRQLAITPFADADKHDREYVFRLTDAVLALARNDRVTSHSDTGDKV